MRVLSRAAIVAVVLAGTAGSAAADAPAHRAARGPVRHAPAAAYHPARAAGEQPHEARIEFPAHGYAGRWTYQPYGDVALSEPDAEDADGIVIDPADYPAGSVFFIRLTVRYYTNLGGCSRLYDASIQEPVAASTVCEYAGLPGTRVLDSPPLELSAGEHVYDLQGMQEPQSDPTPGVEQFLLAGQLIIRWTE
jgi:hypothetical protein